MTPGNKIVKKEKSTLGKVLLRLRRCWPLLALSLLFAVASSALTLYVPILVGGAVDLIIGKGTVDFPGVLDKLVRMGIAAGTAALMQWVMNVVNNRVTFQVIRDVRNEAVRKIAVLPLKYLDGHAHGEIVNRVIADADQFADGLLLGFTQLFTGVVTILGTLAFMLAISWRIALVVVLLTPVSLLAARFIARRTYSLFREQAEIRAEQTALVDEMLENEKVIQAFSREEKALEYFDEINARLEKCSVSALFFSSIANPVTRFVNSLVYAGVGLAGALTSVATGGFFSVGRLAVFLSYASQYAKPFNEISGVITELQNALACAARIFALIDETPESPDAANAAVLENISGHVELDGVEFSYSPGKKLIRDLSLQVRPGQRIALVGPTGCGKTTVINLLMRFYDVAGGSIRVEGTDIRDVTRRSLRGGYGMVLQETWLKAGTVRENIALGKPDATDAEIIAAAGAAHAHSFIMRLPEGYDTPIGEDGGSLSQGQRQLLCIARVMLCLPPMLILDEATSSVDTCTELKIQAAFSRLMRGRTSFIAAHRLSTIRGADMILVMNNGGIIEQGKHEVLLARGGFYAELYNSQFAV
ncbi:MAG: ABC transporter ATP-binding protein/permease [Oscillospiraceae bacterium]|jgi:ATP-binding cassette subfamily B protein|nr:ABC transporter ATP-binding protein/permease [Oscillospiraceae bacterium]